MRRHWPIRKELIHYIVGDARITYMKLINLAQPHPLNHKDPGGEIEDNAIMGESVQVESSVASSEEEETHARTRKVIPV